MTIIDLSLLAFAVAAITTTSLIVTFLAIRKIPPNQQQGQPQK